MRDVELWLLGQWWRDVGGKKGHGVDGEVVIAEEGRSLCFVGCRCLMRVGGRGSRESGNLVDVELHDVAFGIGAHGGEGVAEPIRAMKRLAGTLTIGHRHENTGETTDGLPSYSRDKDVGDTTEISLALCRRARGTFADIEEVSICA